MLFLTVLSIALKDSNCRNRKVTDIIKRRTRKIHFLKFSFGFIAQTHPHVHVHLFISPAHSRVRQRVARLCMSHGLSCWQRGNADLTEQEKYEV